MIITKLLAAQQKSTCPQKHQATHSLRPLLEIYLIKLYIPMNLCAQLLYILMNLCARATAHFDESIKTEYSQIKPVADERTLTSRNSFFSHV